MDFPIAQSRASAPGISIAVLVIASWVASLVLGFSLRLEGAALWVAIPLAALNTFLSTGLFITAHDAMHGLVAPARPRLNAVVGSLCVRLYALFSFDRLRAEHVRHHHTPASAEDPDFHGGDAHPVRWYLHFMRTYVTWAQLLGMAIAFNVFVHVLHVPVANVVLFWAGPALLSTVQLFVFGTYLPHREPDGGYRNQYRAQSNAFAPWLSFLTCYHFGYHFEHHARPDVPWWRLPSIRREAPKGQVDVFLSPAADGGAEGR